MPKLTLYTYPGSVWASAPLLAVHELGYTDPQIDKKTVDLAAGANFRPDFLAINPQGTLPTLVVDAPDKIYTDTASVVRYLVEHAPRPAGTDSGTDLVDRLHDDAIDPNFTFMASRSEAELKAKAAGIHGAFTRGRHATLTRLLPAAPPHHTPLLTTKLASTTHLLALLDGTAPPAPFLAHSTAHWARVASFLLADLPHYLPPPGCAFVGGARPAAEDFHLAAWLARTVAVLGGTPGAEGVYALEDELGGEGAVPRKVVAYWAAWAERESWREVYRDGLH